MEVRSFGRSPARLRRLHQRHAERLRHHTQRPPRRFRGGTCAGTAPCGDGIPGGEEATRGSPKSSQFVTNRGGIGYTVTAETPEKQAFAARYSSPSVRTIRNAEWGIGNGDRELSAVVRRGHGHRVVAFA